MASNSVGTLTTFINADAAQFMKEWDKVDRRIARASKSFTEPGAKLALGFVGVENALKAVANEVRFVIANVENIPGVSPETVASIITMRDNLASAKNWIDQMTAGAIAFGVQFAQSVGAGAASLMGYKDTGGLSKLETPDEIAAAKDPGYHDKIRAATAKLADVRKASALAAMDEVKQIIELRKQADAYETNSRANSKNTIERLEAQAAAQDKLTQANAKMAALRKQLDGAETKTGEAFGATILAGSLQPQEARLKDLQQTGYILRRKLAELSAGDQNDPQNLKTQITLREALTKIYEQQVPLLEKQKELAKEVGNSIASGFEDAVFAGKTLSETIRAISTDLLRLAFRKSITEPMAAGISGAFANFFGGFFADGGRPPMGKASIVGENGPELFVPDTAGRIIPNRSLSPSSGRASEGGASGAAGAVVVNQHYTIGAGVTAAQLLPILAMQKRDLLATLADARRRRTSLGAALA